MMCDHMEAAKVAPAQGERLFERPYIRVPALLATALFLLPMALACGSNGEADGSLWKSGYVDGFKAGIKRSCDNSTEAQVAIQDRPDTYRRAYDEGYREAQALIATYSQTSGDVIGSGSQQDPCQQTNGPDVIPSLP